MSLFFILSGYVLSLRHFGSRMNLQNYYRGRFARIYPVYLLAAVVTLPWLSAHFGPSGHFEYDINFRQLIFLIFSNIFALQAWLPDMFFYWNDGGSWSISVEVFFYALFPLLIGLISKMEPRNFLFAIIICYIATSLPGLSLSAFYTARDAAFYSVPIYRLPEFLLGIFTFVLTKRFPGVIQQRYVADAVVAALIVYLTLLGGRFSLYVGNNWFVVPAICLLIASAAGAKSIFSTLLSSRLMVWLGKISYSFYSIQLFVLLFLDHNRNLIILHVPALASNRVLALAALLVLTVLSAGTYHFVEEPCRKLLGSRRLVSPTIVVS